MFEAIVAMCLSLPDGPCREGMLPGYEAPTAQACAAALAARPPDLAGLLTRGDPYCAPAGVSLDMVETAPGVFVHEGRVEVPSEQNRGDVANLAFVIGDDAVAVVDTGAGRWLGEALWRAIRAETDKPVTHVILTHMHPDHVFGAGPLVEAGARVVGHPNLPRALGDRQANYSESLQRLMGVHFAGSGSVAIDVVVDDRLVIDLGQRVLTLQAWPTAHTAADVTVLDETSGTLFAGDLIFHRHTPALDGRLLGWQAVVEALQGLDVAQAVPGHGGPLLEWPMGARDQLRYLETLARDTRRAIASGVRLSAVVDQIAQSERAAWELFDDYNPRNATAAFTELEWE